MASVYLAELQTEIGFKRKVALKVVRSEFAKDRKFVALMAREAMIGSLLQHPNIVQTLEFNEADGRCFLALEYVEGQTLEQLLSKHRKDGGGGLPLAVALEAMVQVLKGLSYAHTLLSPEGEDMGIVHRDLKPANIMLSRHGLVKVMDFGIAKARIASANITTVGQVRGTPIYMAPEQVTGKDLDGRADQFAAATVLYELLTGKQLFTANNLMKIMQQVARAEVDEQLQEIKKLHPGIAPVAARMWSKNTEDRYATCDEPAQILEDIVFELKAKERATRGTSGTEEAAARTDGGDPGPRPGSTLFSALGLLVRNLFGTVKAPPPPPPKKRRRRKRKKRLSERETAAAPPVGAEQPGPTALDSVEMEFDDQVSDFGLPTMSKSQSTPNIAPAAAPPEPLLPEPVSAPEPTAEVVTAPPPAPGPGDEAPPPVGPTSPQPETTDQPGEDLDRFFYENYD